MRTVVAAAVLLAAGCSDPVACTLIDCSDRLTVTVAHALDLSGDDVEVELRTPLQEVSCAVGPEAQGQDSCFGFRFADVRWEPGAVTVELLEPFEGGASFEEVEIVVSQAGVEVARLDVPLEEETVRPNGPGYDPICRLAEGDITLP